MDDVNKLIHLFPQAENRQITNSVEQVIVKWSPLVNLYFTVRHRIFRRVHALVIFLLRSLFILSFLVGFIIELVFVLILRDFLEVAYNVKSLLFNELKWEQ